MANLYNSHHRVGKESQYTWENVCIVPGGRAGLIRIAAVIGKTIFTSSKSKTNESIGNAYLGFFVSKVRVQEADKRPSGLAAPCTIRSWDTCSQRFLPPDSRLHRLQRDVVSVPQLQRNSYSTLSTRWLSHASRQVRRGNCTWYQCYPDIEPSQPYRPGSDQP